MLGFSPIGSSALATAGNGFKLTAQVPSISLTVAKASIGISAVSGINLSSAIGEAYFSSNITVVSPVVSLGFPSGLVGAGSGMVGGVASVTIGSLSATYAASKGNIVTVNPVNLSTLASMLNISSSIVGGVGSVVVTRPNAIPVVSAARVIDTSLLTIGLGSFTTTFSATSNPIGSVKSLSFGLPTGMINATVNVYSAIDSINFDLGIGHTFTYEIKDSVVVVCLSRGLLR